MALDKVKVVFDVDGAAFDRGTAKIKEGVGNLRNELLGNLKTAIFATFSVQALKEFDAEFKKVVDTLEAARQMTGAKTTDLQVWEKQMDDLGGSINDVTMIINKLAAAREKAMEDPTGKEAKAFAKLGFDEGTLGASDGAAIFKRLQETISANGGAAGAMGSLMDILGDKAVKTGALFAQSFEDTAEQMKVSGRLIESELISKYKQLDEINEDLSVGDAMFGGKTGKGGLVTSIKEAWLHVKSGLQSLTVPIAFASDAIGATDGLSKRIWSQIEDTQTRLMLDVNSSSTVADLFQAGTLGSLTPAQQRELELKNLQTLTSKETQLERIEALQKSINEKALTDEERLKAKQEEQIKLIQEMEELEKNRGSKDTLNAKMELYLRNLIKVKELEEKVTSEKEKQAEKTAKDKEKQDKLVGDYMKKANERINGYQMSDNLTGTGNFLGTARARLMEANQFEQTKLLEKIEENTRLFLQKNPNVSSVEEFPAL